MKGHQEFKDKKIGKIPKEWEVVRLGDKNIVDLIMGQSPPSSTYNDKGIGLPFLQGNAEFGDIYPTPIFSCSQPTKLSEKNDILLSVRAPVGDINITPYKLCIGRGLAAIRPKSDKLYYLFLFYYLKSGSRIFESFSMGSTFKAIRKEEVEKYQLPLPPLPEQKKIAEILATSDEAIQKVDEAIDKTQRLKKGLMQQLLIKGIGHKEFKESKIGRISREWEVGKLGENADFKNGLNFKKEQKGKKGVLTVDVLNMYGENIYLNFDNLYRIDTPLNNNSEYLLKKGDILFVRSSLKREGAGWVSLFNDWNEPTTFCGFIIRARLNNPNILPKFLVYFLRSDKARSKLIGGSGQVAITNITQETIRLLNIPLPSLPEQQKISEILSTVDKKLELLREKKETFERIKKGLMNDLLNGRKRVKFEA
jgi:type I restriction enzyme S subunit